MMLFLLQITDSEIGIVVGQMTQQMKLKILLDQMKGT